MKAKMPKNYDPAFDDNDYSNADYNPRLHHLINEVIENQLRDNDPPEARETLERLMVQGGFGKRCQEKDRCSSCDPNLQHHVEQRSVR